MINLMEPGHDPKSQVMQRQWDTLYNSQFSSNGNGDGGAPRWWKLPGWAKTYIERRRERTCERMVEYNTILQVEQAKPRRFFNLFLTWLFLVTIIAFCVTIPLLLVPGFEVRKYEPGISQGI
eukprot:sb/3475988/